MNKKTGIQLRPDVPVFYAVLFHPQIIGLWFILCLFFSCFFCSCFFRSRSSSFTDHLVQIDALFSAGDYSEAFNLLEKAAKKANKPYEKLGIVRRALLLDRRDYAEKYIKKALRTFPENQEIIAVYTHLLYTENRRSEALKLAPKLEGGKYGSLYSALRFKTDFTAKTSADFYSPAYLQAYLDAALTTGNSGYIRNAALVEAVNGNIEAAFAYHPINMSVYDSPWFWAQISYDSYNFETCSKDLQLLDHTSENIALLSDTYLRAGNERDAFLFWLDSTNLFPKANPQAWYNAARASLQDGNLEQAQRLLFSLVENFPDYTPGLTAYGRFTLLSPQSSDTLLAGILKERGFKTLRMSLDDMLPRVLPADALYRMEQSLSRRKTAQGQKETSLLKVFQGEHVQAEQAQADADTMTLALEHTKLQWAAAKPALEERQKTAAVWALLENTLTEGRSYNPLLAHYALWYFCSQNMIEDAEKLFLLYCAERYAEKTQETPQKKSGQETPAVSFPVFGMEDWEYDIGAYIALKQQNYLQAEKWLSALSAKKNTGPLSPLSAALNLAALYKASGRRLQAMELYKNALLISTSKQDQADIYYKIALIQYEQKENRSAVLSLNQCLSLDAAHNSARLMLKKIQHK